MNYNGNIACECYKSTGDVLSFGCICPHPSGHILSAPERIFIIYIHIIPVQIVYVRYVGNSSLMMATNEYAGEIGLSSSHFHLRILPTLIEEKKKNMNAIYYSIEI